MALLGLLASTFIVGALIGCVGIGGILLIPALEVLADVSIQEAMATSLFTFTFTGILGTILYHRRGSIDWPLTIPICASALIFAYPGAWLNSQVNASFLNTLLAILIALAGIYALLPQHFTQRVQVRDSTARKLQVLIVLGGVAGFGSGLTGVGGPVILVPMMVVLGFAPLVAVSASQVIQILAGISGSLGHLTYGTINFELSGWLIFLLLGGVIVGVKVAHAAKVEELRRIVAIVCIVVGVATLLRSV